MAISQTNQHPAQNQSPFTVGIGNKQEMAAPGGFGVLCATSRRSDSTERSFECDHCSSVFIVHHLVQYLCGDRYYNKIRDLFKAWYRIPLHMRSPLPTMNMMMILLMYKLLLLFASDSNRNKLVVDRDNLAIGPNGNVQGEITISIGVQDAMVQHGRCENTMID
jgi:hypothetical protein